MHPTRWVRQTPGCGRRGNSRYDRLHSGLPTSTLIEVGNDHRLANSEPLAAMLTACERLGLPK